MLARGISRLRAAPARSSARRYANVTLSESRLQEFMQAEISHFAQMSPRPVKLTQILSASRPEQVAQLIHAQLPRHFATRIKHLETLPMWETVPELVQVHEILSESFRNLRMVEQGTGPVPLTGVIRDLRKRHKAVIPLLGAAVATLREEAIIDDAFANQWLDTFLLARIGTEMLTAHYMSMHAGQDEGGSSGSCTGIVDSRCSPGEVCRQAAEKVGKDAECGSVPIHVESHVCSTSRESIEFSFLPQYLSLIVEELLKNGAAATMRARAAAAAHGMERPQDETIQVIVAADQRQVKIQISDKGGGIPACDANKVWSYCQTTWEGHSWSDPMAASLTSWEDPLAGLGIRRRLGMGLPLSKLYTEYLGGSLELMSLSGVGVDAFLSLRRIDVERGSGMASIDID